MSYYLEISQYHWKDLNLPGPYVKLSDFRTVPYKWMIMANKVWHEYLDSSGNIAVELLKSRTAHLSRILTEQDMHEFIIVTLRAHDVRLQTG